MKTRGVDDRPNDYTELVIGALPAESEELVVWRHHSYMDIRVLEIHAGHPLCGCMMAMMECRISILNEVLQIFKLKNFRFKMGLRTLSFMGIRK